MGIKIILNGKEQVFDSPLTIEGLLGIKKIRPETCTVELNDRIIRRQDYPRTALSDGDRVEIVFFIGGGGGGGGISDDDYKRSVKSGFKVARDVLDLIFNTPIVKINRLAVPSGASIFAKLESYSPGGSVKDRIAFSMIQNAEKKGLLRRDSIIVEPTSGNTGIGIALVCAVKGYKCILTMPESMSLERIYILKSYGASIELTPAVEGMAGAVARAREIVARNKNAVMPEQFGNPANPDVHFRTTAREIFEALDGKIDFFVSGVGTGGTITGVGRYLKSKIPKVRIIAVEPERSPVLSGGAPGPHKIQGIGAGFIPSVLDRKIIDEVIKVSDENAYNTAREIAVKEGIFCGISSGAAAWAALEVSRTLATNTDGDKNIVTIFPDTGERYFSVRQYFEI